MSTPAATSGPLSSTTVEPTLYALLSSSSSSPSSSSSSHSSLLSHASKLSFHSENYHVVERVYTCRESISTSPSSLKGLRFKSRFLQAQGEGKWFHTLSYVSPPLRSAEYSMASTRAVIDVELPSGNVEDIKQFIHVLGFDHSHTFTLKGHLFHFPLPLPSFPQLSQSHSQSQPLTLHLSITHLEPSSNSESETVAPNEPYLVRLQPSRPVHAVPHPGTPDIPLQDLISLMRDVAVQFDGLEWSTAAR